MDKLIATKEFIAEILNDSRFAVLATEGDGQPHASLIAVTPMEGFRKLIFATYRNTRKYTNIKHNGKVAVLVESGDSNSLGLLDSFVLTAFGCVEEIAATDSDAVYKAHLEKHPDLLSFMQTEDCVILRINVERYEVVRGIDDVEWWTLDDLDAQT